MRKKLVQCGKLACYYMATKKKKPSGSQAEQVKKWAHSDEMSFLDNFIKERPEQSSSLANKNGPHTFEVMIDDNETGSSFTCAKRNIPQLLVQIDLRNDTPVREKKPKMSALEAKLVEIMDKPENFDSCSRCRQYAKPIGERRQ
uniref:Uncharacterized protein n=1 Tax=Ditylenchus dipsaci TaxID=166011 RepID=A0A915DBZ1_9BILA